MNFYTYIIVLINNLFIITFWVLYWTFWVLYWTFWVLYWTGAIDVKWVGW